MATKNTYIVRVTDYVPLKDCTDTALRKFLNAWEVNSRYFKAALRQLKQRGIYLTYKQGCVEVHLNKGGSLGLVAFVDGQEFACRLQLLTLLMNVSVKADFQEYLPIFWPRDISPHHGELSPLESLDAQTWHEILLPWKLRDVTVVLENKSEFVVKTGYGNSQVRYIAITRAPDWPLSLLIYLKANYKRFAETVE